jgi:hypothetical protein
MHTGSGVGACIAEAVSVRVGLVGVRNANTDIATVDNAVIV